MDIVFALRLHSDVTPDLLSFVCSQLATAFEEPRQVVPLLFGKDEAERSLAERPCLRKDSGIVFLLDLPAHSRDEWEYMFLELRVHPRGDEG